MSDGVFIVRDDNTLVEMRSSPFESEDLLQELLATHPSLIAGDAVDPTNPRPWLLIAREQAVSGEEDGAGRWSLDHPVVDQDGVPTLVTSWARTLRPSTFYEKGGRTRRTFRRSARASRVAARRRVRDRGDQLAGVSGLG